MMFSVNTAKLTARLLAFPLLSIATAVSVCAWQADDWQERLYIPLDDPAIRYHQRTARDPIARLEDKLEAGRAKLDYASNGLGYLPSLLAALDVKVDSQILVFSRTSAQSSHISPAAPRAIYFNDEVAIGYVQGGELIELTGLDPELGVVTYTLDNAKSVSPRIGRQEDCLRCHQGPATLAVPGLMVSSVHPRSDDPTEGHGSAFVTDQRIPLKERWGGWYVTGTTGSQSHLGNNVALADPLHPGDANLSASQNVTSLDAFFDTSRYLTGTSDIVALMTLEHQCRMANLITRVGWDARIAIREKKSPDAIVKELAPEIEEMISYMLFAGEASIQEPVAGVSTFAKTFPDRGPRDSHGRSLRDFDLHTRLFRYPLSYMIYSPAFNGLPGVVRARIYERLYSILTGQDPDPKFSRLSPDERGAIVAILRATKSDLPAFWRSSTAR